MDDRIREKLARLVRLVRRPGTPGEGEAARLAAIRLSLKYGIDCEFTANDHISATATTAAPDAIFYQWVKALSKFGWGVYDCTDTKIGRQIKFRNPGFRSEIRVTQRGIGVGDEFEAEHIMQPDPINGFDLSWTSFITVNLNELLRHISYTKQTSYA